MRTITVASTTRTGAKSISSNATHWGQLRRDLRDTFGDIDNMRAVIRETRNDLTSDEAILPEGDFTLLLTPMQIKGGAKDVDVIKILQAVAEDFCESIENIIEEIKDGDYDVKAKVADKLSSTSSSLQKDLEDLKNGKI